MQQPPASDNNKRSIYPSKRLGGGGGGEGESGGGCPIKTKDQTILIAFYQIKWPSCTCIHSDSGLQKTRNLKHIIDRWSLIGPIQSFQGFVGKSPPPPREHLLPVYILLSCHSRSLWCAALPTTPADWLYLWLYFFICKSFCSNPYYMHWKRIPSVLKMIHPIEEACTIHSPLLSDL